MKKKNVTPQPLHFGTGISTVKMDAKFEILFHYSRNDQDRLRQYWKQCWDAHNQSNGVQEAQDMILKAVDISQLSDF